MLVLLMVGSLLQVNYPDFITLVIDEHLKDLHYEVHLLSISVSASGMLLDLVAGVKADFWQLNLIMMIRIWSLYNNKQSFQANLNGKMTLPCYSAMKLEPKKNVM